MNSVTVYINNRPGGGEVRHDENGYYYESDNGVVLLTDEWFPDLEGTYRKIIHTPKGGCGIKDIKYSGTGQSGFGTLTTYTSVSVYYWSRDNSFSNPLLIQLGTGDNEYYASADGTSWAKDHEASTSKLRDSLNKQNCGKNNAHIIKISEKSSGGYKCPMCSKDIQLSYQNQSGYDHYRHTISDSFSVTSFRDGNDWQLGLPSLRDISHIQVYCDSTSRGKLLLIYYDHGGHNWFKRNTSTENTWSGFPNDKVLELLNSDNYYPKITIKLSTSAGKLYSDNGVTITVRNSPIGDGYYKCQHSLCGGLFELNGVKRTEQTLLTGITSGDILENVTAYYYGDSPNLDKLLLLELRSQGGKNYNYFYRPTKDPLTWSPYLGSGETTRLLDDKLKTELYKLKKEHFPSTQVTTNPQQVPSSTPESTPQEVSSQSISSNVANPSSSEPKLNNSTSAKSASLIGSAVGGAVYALVAAVVIVLLVKFWPRIRTKFVKI